MPPNARKPAVRGRRLARALWRLGRVYWGSSDAKAGLALLLGAVALELATVWTHVLIADANRLIFDALEQKQAEAFFRAFGFFLALGLVFVLATTYRIFLRQTLEMRWRRSLTSYFVTRWPAASTTVRVRVVPASSVSLTSTARASGAISSRAIAVGHAGPGSCTLPSETNAPSHFAS